MFANLSVKNFTWPREPVLYLTLFVAIANLAIQAIGGDLSWFDAAESAFVLIMGFIARGQVTPVGGLDR